jgi:hypothetical protein
MPPILAIPCYRVYIIEYWHRIIGVNAISRRTLIAIVCVHLVVRYGGLNFQSVQAQQVVFHPYRTIQSSVLIAQVTPPTHHYYHPPAKSLPQLSVAVSSHQRPTVNPHDPVDRSFSALLNHLLKRFLHLLSHSVSLGVLRRSGRGWVGEGGIHQ